MEKIVSDKKEQYRRNSRLNKLGRWQPPPSPSNGIDNYNIVIFLIHDYIILIKLQEEFNLFYVVEK